MATIQQVTDLSFDLKNLEREIVLKKIFSPNLLGELKRLGLDTYEKIKARTILTSAGSRYLQGELKGIEYMEGLETIAFQNADKIKGVLPLTSLINTISIDLRNCSGVTGIGVVSNSRSLSYLNLENCSKINHIGLFDGLDDLVTADISNTNISDVGHVYSNALVTFKAVNCPLPTSVVDDILEDALASYNDTGVLATLYLQGAASPTGGTGNADYIALDAAGVDVQITE